MGLLARLAGISANRPKQTSSADRIAKKSNYGGTAIATRKGSCCEAARATEGRRFLSHEVPMLPLDGCDAASCQCTYRRFDDRRSDPRRAVDVGMFAASHFYTPDKRSLEKPGRRVQDKQ